MRHFLKWGKLLISVKFTNMWKSTFFQYTIIQHSDHNWRFSGIYVRWHALPYRTSVLKESQTWHLSHQSDGQSLSIHFTLFALRQHSCLFNRCDIIYFYRFFLSNSAVFLTTIWLKNFSVFVSAGGTKRGDGIFLSVPKEHFVNKFIRQNFARDVTFKSVIF